MSFIAHDHFYCQWVSESERYFITNVFANSSLCVKNFISQKIFIITDFYHADNNFNVRSRQCSSCKIIHKFFKILDCDAEILLA